MMMGLFERVACRGLAPAVLLGLGLAGAAQAATFETQAKQAILMDFDTGAILF